MDQERRGEGELLVGLDLASVEKRWIDDAPNPAWAERYGGRFAEADAFRVRSRQREAASTQRRLRREKERLLVLVIAVLLAGAGVPQPISCWMFQPQQRRQFEEQRRDGGRTKGVGFGNSRLEAAGC